MENVTEQLRDSLAAMAGSGNVPPTTPPNGNALSSHPQHFQYPTGEGSTIAGYRAAASASQAQVGFLPPQMVDDGEDTYRHPSLPVSRMEQLSELNRAYQQGIADGRQQFADDLAAYYGIHFSSHGFSHFSSPSQAPGLTNIPRSSHVPHRSNNQQPTVHNEPPQQLVHPAHRPHATTSFMPSSDPAFNHVPRTTLLQPATSHYQQAGTTSTRSSDENNNNTAHNNSPYSDFGERYGVYRTYNPNMQSPTRHGRHSSAGASSSFQGMSSQTTATAENAAENASHSRSNSNAESANHGAFEPGNRFAQPGFHPANPYGQPPHPSYY